MFSGDLIGSIEGSDNADLKRLAMTEDRLIDLMMNTWNMRIATIGPVWRLI